MKKYGLQVRVSASTQQKKPTTRPPLPPVPGFRAEDDDDDDVEREISRQASKNKSLKEVDEQHKKALEEDPSVFDYDGVFDEMKQKIVKPRVVDRQEKKPKYIQTLIKKAEERQREHEIVYEKKLAKERSKEDHLYADKDKYVTSAYKKKLAEQAKWMEEERLRQLREDKDDVTKKSDLSDFYFNLGRNVAFGAREVESRKAEKQAETKRPEKEGDARETGEASKADASNKGRLSMDSNSASDTSRVKEGNQSESNTLSKRSFESDSKLVSNEPVTETPAQEKASAELPAADQSQRDHHKRNEDALAAAKERFLARKRAKNQ
ncbi:DUF2040 domain-containing protein [Cephalotus follicularis]|uniref:DUF2040 domain-containing protein n=1 Tax=Cephalotus follicularis TaxID=3775 RepID=A0A1Q3ATE7_CEPFO|nr:DUF2040 domain-containing protein [Cephalotus follicularis]